MKKYLVGGIGVTAIVLSVVSLMTVFAFAQTAPASTPTPSAPVMVSINPNGNALLRGTIESTGADALVIKSWGGNWTVKVTSATKIISKNSALSDFKVGDVAGISGSVVQDGSFTINAGIVRAWGQQSDNDKDGVPDTQDNDDDNDGVLDINEPGKASDHDNDGIVDAQDQDDDNDGISDTNDSKPSDRDNDGENDAVDKND